MEGQPADTLKPPRCSLSQMELYRFDWLAQRVEEQEVVLTCRVKAFPPAQDVSVTTERCRPEEEMGEGCLIQLPLGEGMNSGLDLPFEVHERSEDGVFVDYRFTVPGFGSSEFSGGRVRCRACNEWGCHSDAVRALGSGPIVSHPSALKNARNQRFALGGQDWLSLQAKLAFEIVHFSAPCGFDGFCACRRYMALK